MIIEIDQIMKTPSVLHLGLSDTMDNVKSGIEKYYIDQAFADVEQEIKYVFKDKAYLISAFSHASYCNNNFTQCYERYLRKSDHIYLLNLLNRLEYLGDAVLDFLVIRCIFVEHYDKVTPSMFALFVYFTE
jgi:dsRNA-specific ribonuclease